MARRPSSEYSDRQRAKAKEVADKYLPDPKVKVAKSKKGRGKDADAPTKAELAFARAKEDAERLGRAHKARPEPAASPRPLTEKEWRFIEEYLVDLNGTQAAIRAGYSAKSAAQIAYENLRKPEIRKAVDHLIKERSRATGWTAQRLLDRLGDELDADLQDIHDEAGNIRPIDEWPLVFRQGLVEGIEVEARTEDDGDTTIRIAKVKLASRHKLKEMIGKHVKVSAFVERVQHDVSDPLKEIYHQLAGTGARPTADNSSLRSEDRQADIKPDAKPAGGGETPAKAGHSADAGADTDRPPPAGAGVLGRKLNASESTRKTNPAIILSEQAPEEEPE